MDPIEDGPSSLSPEASTTPRVLRVFLLGSTLLHIVVLVIFIPHCESAFEKDTLSEKTNEDRTLIVALEHYTKNDIPPAKKAEPGSEKKSQAQHKPTKNSLTKKETITSSATPSPSSHHNIDYSLSITTESDSSMTAYVPRCTAIQQQSAIINCDESDERVWASASRKPHEGTYDSAFDALERKGGFRQDMIRVKELIDKQELLGEAAINSENREFIEHEQLEISREVTDIYERHQGLSLIGISPKGVSLLNDMIRIPFSP